jgi:hypothetical protein
MSKFLSGFKNYFHLDNKNKKLTFKKYLSRIGEKWTKDRKFRMKFAIVFMSVGKNIYVDI